MNKPLQRSQLNTLLSLALLSPIIRQIPGTMVRTAGSGAWLSALLSLPVLLVMGAVYCKLLDGQDLASALERGFGRRAGRALTGLMTLWLLFYLGFVLRSGADRFVAALYPKHSIWVFVGVLSAMVLLAQTGSLRQMGRLGQAVEPFLLLFFLLLPLLVLPQVEASLLTLQGGSPGGWLRGIFPVADTLGVAVYGGFLEQDTEGKPRLGSLLLPMISLTALITLLCVSTVGVLGQELTGELYYPFFVLLRTVKLPRFLDRTEAALVAQWLSADFILSALLLRICEGNLARLGLWREKPRLRWGLCMGAAVLGAVFCAGNSYELLRLTENFVPKVNAVMVFGIVPLCRILNKAADMKRDGT